LPPIRTWKGAETVAEPPPELARPLAPAVYVKVRAPTDVIEKVPL
jgi:hypothetical protein